MFDNSDALPPIPAPQGIPHVYALNSDPAFLEVIDDLMRDTRAHVTLEQIRPNVLVTVSNLRSAQPDLVILDYVPYQHNSVELLELLSDDPELRHLPIILASTNVAQAEQVANTYDTLVRDILPKPFDIEEFFAKLTRLLHGVHALY